MSKYGIENTPKEVMLIVAKNIRALRKQKGLTQRDVSERSGVAYATFVKFEQTGHISFESLLKISQTLGKLQEFENIFIPNNLNDKEKLFDI